MALLVGLTRLGYRRRSGNFLRGVHLTWGGQKKNSFYGAESYGMSRNIAECRGGRWAAIKITIKRKRGKGGREGMFGGWEPSRRNKRHFTGLFFEASRHKGVTRA